MTAALAILRLVPPPAWLALAILASLAGALWVAYDAGQDAAEADQAARDAAAVRSRLETDDAVRSLPNRDLCRRLGGGVQCDDL